ncbi:MAG: NAD(P)H-dependent oxidoreductase [Microbacterium sp.]
MSALTISCTLKPSPAESSSEVTSGQLADLLIAQGVAHGHVRAVDHRILPGVETDMGEGDDWPTLREKILTADIVALVTPTWLGQHSSVAQRVLERLDAELATTDADGRPVLFDKVAIVGVVGNEDGAHHIVATLYQALNDVGFTLPAQGCAYWNGEAMHKTDYKDLSETPSSVQSSMSTAVKNAMHLAQLLKRNKYPADA